MGASSTPAGRAARAVALALGLSLATVVPARGQAVPAQPERRLPEAGARRIVALAPHVAELVWAAGAGDRLVGVAAGSDWPPEVRALPRIGAAGRLDRERLAALAPDLAIGWTSGDPPADVAWLRSRGVAVHPTDADRLEDIAAAIRAVGRLAGTQPVAERAAAAFERDLAAVGMPPPGIRPRVFYQVWDRPPMTVSAAHYIGQAIERCGGSNVFASLSRPVPVVSVEAVLAADPDRIIAAGAGGDAFARWRDRPALRAVTSGRAYMIDPDLLHRPGPRVVEGLRQLCAAIAAP